MNRLLLDTHILLWLLEPGAARLPTEARQLIARANDAYVSIVSLWEIAIKLAKGHLDLDLDLLIEAIDAAGLSEVAVEREHVRVLRALPQHHRDPFDRMLVAQAAVEPFHLITSDEKLVPYGDFVVLV
jgi:PIN domain nuclease of toxin-antitoxin system